MKTYAIIANCNFESRDDQQGQAIHAARKAIEAGLTHDAALIFSMDELEETLSEYAESDSANATACCRRAEANVARCYTDAVRDEIDAARVG
jgi:hypothetical protein